MQEDIDIENLMALPRDVKNVLLVADYEIEENVCYSRLLNKHYLTDRFQEIKISDERKSVLPWLQKELNPFNEPIDIYLHPRDQRCLMMLTRNNGVRTATFHKWSNGKISTSKSTSHYCSSIDDIIKFYFTGHENRFVIAHYEPQGMRLREVWLRSWKSLGCRINPYTNFLDEHPSLQSVVIFLDASEYVFNQMVLMHWAYKWLTAKNAPAEEGKQILRMLKNQRLIPNKYHLIWRTTTQKYGNLFKRVHEKVHESQEDFCNVTIFPRFFFG